MESHRLGVTWSHFRVFHDKSNFDIILFLRVRLAQVCLGITQVAQVCAPEHPGALVVCNQVPWHILVHLGTFTVLYTTLHINTTKICKRHEKFQLVHAAVCLCEHRCAKVWQVYFGDETQVCFGAPIFTQ